MSATNHGTPIPAATPQGGETSATMFQCRCGKVKGTLGGSYCHHCFTRTDWGRPAAAPVEEGREGETASGAVTLDATLTQYPQEGTLNIPAASRAPHEGPTSGLREDVAATLAELQAIMDMKEWPCSRCSDIDDEPTPAISPEGQAALRKAMEALAASPLAPTSDGALRAVVKSPEVVRALAHFAYRVTLDCTGAGLEAAQYAAADIAKVLREELPDLTDRGSDALAVVRAIAAASRPVVENTGETR